MKSRDGFEVVNELVREEVNRRAGAQRARLVGRRARGGPSRWPCRARRAQTPKRGGTIKIGSFQNIDTLDAHNTTFITACGIHNNIYNGLLKITSTDGKSVDFKPELAREWEIQGDRVHVFRLHKGVTFHNGDPCTAADVKWNLERVKDKNAGAHPRLEARAAGVDRDARPAYREAARSPSPTRSCGSRFTGSTGRAATILSPRAVKEKGKAYGRSPVGTGPFKFVEWKEGDFIPLERYPNYWETDAARRQAAVPRQGPHQVHHRALDAGGRAQDRRGRRRQQRGAAVRRRPPQGPQAQRLHRGRRQLALPAHEHRQGAVHRQEPAEGGGLRDRPQGDPGEGGVRRGHHRPRAHLAADGRASTIRPSRRARTGSTSISSRPRRS